MTQTQAPPSARSSPAIDLRSDGREAWETRTRIVLTPLAAPSILGLFGFAGATFMVSAFLAGWYGSDTTPVFLFPFALFFGGVAQFLAGMWAYRARDGLATAMHGMWGAFWVGWGLLYGLIGAGVLTEPKPTFVELGYWFIVLGAITLVGAVAALAENGVLAAVLFPLAAGAGLAAVHFMTTIDNLDYAAGYCFMAAAVIAFYLASAMMLEESFGRVVLPLGKYSRSANVPGSRPTEPVQYEHGMPGARVGQ